MRGSAAALHSKPEAEAGWRWGPMCSPCDTVQLAAEAIRCGFACRIQRARRRRVGRQSERNLELLKGLWAHGISDTRLPPCSYPASPPLYLPIVGGV